MVKVDSFGKMEWNKTYGGLNFDRAWSIVQTCHREYVVAGHTESLGAGNEDLWLVRTDPDGNMKWNKTYGRTGNERAYNVIQTRDGGYCVAGVTSSFGAGNDDMWLLKLASEISWEHIFEDSCRKTTLKISADDKHFQFVAPDETFTIKHDADMCVREYRGFTLIGICYWDDEIELSAFAIDGRFDSCFAYAKDMQTGKTYCLIDRPDWRGGCRRSSIR